MRHLLVALLLSAPQVAAPPAPHPGDSIPGDWSRAEAERFLRTAEVIDREAIPIGITRPQRLTLTDGRRTERAVWKTIDEYRPLKRFADGGLPDVGFRDSWKSEIAAYELAKLIGFDFVPPTVARRLLGTDGSLQLWIDDCVTEAARREQGRTPPDEEAWVRQIYDARLFRQLEHDTDYRNLSNLLVDPGFRLWVVDHSRAFKTQPTILDLEQLPRVSRRHVERLRELTPELLAARLGGWLTKPQRRGLLARRDQLLEHVARRVAAHGEDAVYY